VALHRLPPLQPSSGRPACVPVEPLALVCGRWRCSGTRLGRAHPQSRTSARSRRTGPRKVAPTSASRRTLRQAQAPRCERAGPGRPGRAADLGLRGATRCPPRYGRRPRARPDRRSAGSRTGGDRDNGYRGAGFRVPQRRRPPGPETGRRRRLSRQQREVNAAHAAQRGPGERANAQLKSWRVLHKIRCCPLRATSLVKAVLAVILAS
jgi:hypothetical protein